MDWPTLVIIVMIILIGWRIYTKTKETIKTLKKNVKRK